jgi:diaminopimelate epimerase
MKINFWKMHGAGNDFLLIDDRKMEFPASEPEWIERISARKTGVGSDGILLIQDSEKADFAMRFFNPDGGEAEMCGNGARCIARLAHEIGVAPAKMTIDTAAGRLGAEMVGDDVRLFMTDPVDWRMDRTLKVEGQDIGYDFLNSGVPHAVVVVENLAEHDVEGMGAAIRYHADFQPAGTNANFIAVTGEQALSVRTYERGVEGETLACGTGMVASAVTAGKAGRVASPVKITAASGDVLEVDYELTQDGARDVTLLGPAVHVFEGTLEY